MLVQILARMFITFVFFACVATYVYWGSIMMYVYENRKNCTEYTHDWDIKIMKAEERGESRIELWFPDEVSLLESMAIKQRYETIGFKTSYKDTLFKYLTIYL